MVAGELKTLKTYLAQAILLGVAGGVPVLGEFEVAEPQTVLVYIGEGGRDPYMDRLDRMASAYGLDDAWESRCHFRFGSCPFTSPDFQRA
jgi:RecA-family ATPase